MCCVKYVYVIYQAVCVVICNGVTDVCAVSDNVIITFTNVISLKGDGLKVKTSLSLSLSETRLNFSLADNMCGTDIL